MADTDWKDILGWNETSIEDLRFIGYAYFRQGKYDITRTVFEALLLLDGGSSKDLETLGAVCLNLDDPESALSYLEKALALTPHEPNLLLNQAKAFLTLGYKEKGLAVAKKLKKDPDLFISSQAEALILAYS